MRLRSMTPDELAGFLQAQLVEYAEQMLLAGEWPRDEALDRSLAANERLLNGDALRDGHEILVGVVDGEPVGALWVGPPPARLGAGFLFLYQITVDEAQRGRGHGRALLAALERRAAKQGWPEIRLNVLLWNEVALRLYESAGWTRVATFERSAHYAKRLA